MTHIHMAEIKANHDGKFPAYAWPGGYPLYYLCSDNGILCPKCANNENGSEAHQNSDGPDEWRIVAYEIHYEGEPIVCDHCGAEVESAYGDPDKED